MRLRATVNDQTHIGLLDIIVHGIGTGQRRIHRV
jgi:hypothetical protein